MASKKRSISFNEELDLKLVELCEALSVNPNNYITNVVAKAVLNDRTALVSQQNSSDGMDKLIQLIGSQMEQPE